MFHTTIALNKIFHFIFLLILSCIYEFILLKSSIIILFLMIACKKIISNDCLQIYYNFLFIYKKNKNMLFYLYGGVLLSCLCFIHFFTLASRMGQNKQNPHSSTKHSYFITSTNSSKNAKICKTRSYHKSHLQMQTCNHAFAFTFFYPIKAHALPSISNAAYLASLISLICTSLQRFHHIVHLRNI